MRRILSATEYEALLRSLSPEAMQQGLDVVAAAARELMAQRGLHRAVVLCGRPLQRMGGLVAAQLRATMAVWPEDELPDLSDRLIVDMLFSPAGDPRYAAWIDAMEKADDPVLSVAIPAGVDPDSGKIRAAAVKAVLTVAPFGYLMGLFLHEGLDHCGRILPVGGEIEGEAGLTRFEDTDARRLLPPRRRTAHKGDAGKALLCVGSPRYVGAGLLSARACLAAGCGILYVACPDVVRMALCRLPEAIGVPVGPDWNEKTCRAAIGAMAGMSALGVGCGVGSGDISSLIEAALKTGLPLVLDADGLNCLSRHPALYGLLHEKVVLTPHPGEMSRLTGLPLEQVLEDPVAVAGEHARRWGCIVLLKGAATVVSDGRRTRFVAEGNAGLGKGGSGDVLTGIVAGLLAQGVSPFDGACLGSYLLGASAEKAFDLLRERMLRATNVTEALEEWNE